MQHFGDRALRLAGAVARRRSAIDLGGGVAVVVHHLIGSVPTLHRHDGAERHHSTSGAARVQLADLFGMRSELRLSLNVHLIGPAESVEIVHVQ